MGNDVQLTLPNGTLLRAKLLGMKILKAETGGWRAEAHLVTYEDNRRRVLREQHKNATDAISNLREKIPDWREKVEA